MAMDRLSEFLPKMSSSLKEAPVSDAAGELIAEYQRAVKQLQQELRIERAEKERLAANVSSPCCPPAEGLVAPQATIKKMETRVATFILILEEDEEVDRPLLLSTAHSLARLLKKIGASEPDTAAMEKEPSSSFEDGAEAEKTLPPSDIVSTDDSDCARTARKVLKKSKKKKKTRAPHDVAFQEKLQAVANTATASPRQPTRQNSLASTLRMDKTASFAKRSLVEVSTSNVGMRSRCRSLAPSSDEERALPMKRRVSLAPSRLLQKELPRPTLFRGNSTLSVLPVTESVPIAEGFLLRRSASLPVLPSWEVMCEPAESGLDLSLSLAPQLEVAHPMDTPKQYLDEFDKALNSSRGKSELKQDDERQLMFASADSDSDDLIVVAGDIRDLIIHIASEHTPSNSDFDTLLLTHKRFVSSTRLLSCLAHPFSTAKPDDKTNELTNLNTLLCYWLKAFPNHFAEGTALNRDFLDFLEDEVKPQCTATSEYLRRLLESRLAALVKESMRKPLEFHLSPRTANVEMLQVHPKDLARELTLQQSSAFKQLDAESLIGNDRAEAPSVVHLVTLFNRTSHWVATEVLTTANVKKRATVISRLIAVAKHCLALNNFASMMQIVSGLGIMPVSRLKKTWKLVPKKSIQRLEKLQEIVQPTSNYANYKRHLAETALPAIPYVGLYLRNATFIEDGNPSILENDMINMEKIRMLGLLVREVRYFQLSEYRIAGTTRARALLNSMHVLSDMDELYELSYRSEPRATSD